MQTITVKALNPTNTRGKRIKATISGGHGITRGYDYGVDESDNFMLVAKELKDSLGWSGKMHGGHTKEGMVFVFNDDGYIID